MRQMLNELSRTKTDRPKYLQSMIQSFLLGESTKEIVKVVPFRSWWGMVGIPSFRHTSIAPKSRLRRPNSQA